MQIHRMGSPAHNWYLIDDGGKATVIDAGCSKEFPDLVAGLASAGMTLEDVEVVLITHAHSDHFGFAKEAIEGGLTVRVHEEEEERALGRYRGKFAVTPQELPLWKPSVIRVMLHLVRRGVMKLPFVASVDTFADGDTIDAPGRPTVVHTPGHTEGHAAFHLADAGVLFSGDAFVTMSRTGGDPGPQMLADPFHNDPAQARQSLQRLATLDTRIIYPGHGEPIAGQIADLVALLR